MLSREREGRLLRIFYWGIEALPYASAGAGPHLEDPASDLCRIKIMQKQY